MLVAFGSVLGGLILLVVGAESLVRGAASLALRMGVSMLVVGLTIVAFGTSSPELVVSVKAALAGKADLALGNIMGSNISNLAVILGISAVVCPIACQTVVVRREIPIMIGVVALLGGLILIDGLIEPRTASEWQLSRLAGVILFLLALLYTFLTYRASTQELPPPDEHLDDGILSVGKTEAARGRSLLLDVVYILLGLGLLYLGGELLVDGSVEVAKALGLSELLIGLTVVALGTSAPELATALVAALRGQPDIVVGNVVGSNVLNILGVLGATAMITPLDVPPEVISRDLPFCLALSLICLPIMRSGFRVSRIEGAFFVLAYAGYVGFIVSQARNAG